MYVFFLVPEAPFGSIGIKFLAWSTANYKKLKHINETDMKNTSHILLYTFRYFLFNLSIW